MSNVTGLLHRDAIIVIDYRFALMLVTKYVVPLNNDNAASGDIFDASYTKYKMCTKI